MSYFIRFDKKDILTIIGMVDELEPSERRPEETEVYNKAQQILELMNSSEERQRPALFKDSETGRLTIQYGEELSSPVPYNGIAILGNYFAVTDYYTGTFPTNVLLRFMHVSATDREQWERAKGAPKKSLIKKPRWKRSSESDSL